MNINVVNTSVANTRIKILLLTILSAILLTTGCAGDSADTQNNGDNDQYESDGDRMETDLSEMDGDQSAILCKDFPKAFCFEGLQSGTKCEDGIFYYCSPSEPIEPDCISTCQCEERECNGYCRNYAPGQAKCHESDPDGDIDLIEQDTDGDSDIIETELEKDTEIDLEPDGDTEFETELDLDIYDPHGDCTGDCDFESFEPFCMEYNYLCLCYEADNKKFPVNCITICENTIHPVFDRCDYNPAMSANDCICVGEET